MRDGLNKTACRSGDMIYEIYALHIFRSQSVGIVNIEDELHEQLRRAAKASYRSINAQAAFWIRIGMLCETHPGVTFQELVARELRAAGVDTRAPTDAAA